MRATALSCPPPPHCAQYLGPRPQWQLYDLIADPQEAEDLAMEGAWAGVLAALQADIKAWQTVTKDDWLIKWSHE